MNLQQGTINGESKPLIIGGIEFPAEVLTTTEPMRDEKGNMLAKTRTVVLFTDTQSARFLTSVSGQTRLAQYKVVLSIEREPVSEAECQAVGERVETGEQRKARKLADEAASKKALVEAVKAETKSNILDGVREGRKLADEIQASMARLRAMGADIASTER